MQISKECGFYEDLPKERQLACDYLFNKKEDGFVSSSSCYSCPFYAENLFEDEEGYLDSYDMCLITDNELWVAERVYWADFNEEPIMKELEE